MNKVIGILFIAGLFACEKSDCTDAVKAKFKDMTGLDGCGMMIELNNGGRLEPINLEDFSIVPEDGMKIWVNYHATQGGSICMAGELVEIDCIVERE